MRVACGQAIRDKRVAGICREHPFGTRFERQSVVDLNELRVFAYVASLESFSKAADALSIHKSSASRMVARLERELDCQLFVHPARKVCLTNEGHELYEKCAGVLEQIGESVGTLSLRMSRRVHGVRGQHG